MSELNSRQGAKAQYEYLAQQRQPFLDRAREAAALTIPYIFPPEGYTGTQRLATPYQSLGARGLRNLASKLLLIVLPPNNSYFKLGLNTTEDAVPLDPSDTEGQKERTQEEMLFARMERRISMDQESSNIRSAMGQGLRHLTLCGNTLLRLKDDGGARVFKLDSWVIRRTPKGEILKLIVKECVALAALEPEVRAATLADEVKDDRDNVEIYTVVEMTSPGNWRQWQEINDIVVPDSEGTYTTNTLEWLAPRMSIVDGEDYGYGYVVEMMGDLAAYDGLSRHVIDAAAALAKILIMVRPSSSTNPQDLKKPNLSVITGRPEDVAVMGFDKTRDLGFALQGQSDVRERLQFAFLMNTAIQRSGERVTAEEIRYMAQELEDALGGAYSELAQEIQLPLARWNLHRMMRQKKLPELPFSALHIQITTGLQALGRGHDLARLRGFIQDLTAVFGQDALKELLQGPETIKRIGVGWGVETGGLATPQETLDQREANARRQEMINTLLPRMAQGIQEEGEPQ